jgi:hypothetical protein
LCENDYFYFLPFFFFLPLHSILLRPACRDFPIFFLPNRHNYERAFNHAHDNPLVLLRPLHFPTAHLHPALLLLLLVLHGKNPVDACHIHPARNSHGTFTIYASNSGNIVEVSGTDLAAAVEDYDEPSSDK